jgi:hypothetical protein
MPVAGVGPRLKLSIFGLVPRKMQPICRNFDTEWRGLRGTAPARRSARPFIAVGLRGGGRQGLPVPSRNRIYDMRGFSAA